MASFYVWPSYLYWELFISRYYILHFIASLQNIEHCALPKIWKRKTMGWVLPIHVVYLVWYVFKTKIMSLFPNFILMDIWHVVFNFLLLAKIRSYDINGHILLHDEGGTVEWLLLSIKGHLLRVQYKSLPYFVSLTTWNR